MWNRNHNPLFFRLNIKDEYQENERVVDYYQIPFVLHQSINIGLIGKEISNQQKSEVTGCHMIPKKLQSSNATNTRISTSNSSEAVSNFRFHIRAFINRQRNKREIKKRERKGMEMGGDQRRGVVSQEQKEQRKGNSEGGSRGSRK